MGLAMGLAMGPKQGKAMMSPEGERRHRQLVEWHISVIIRA
jgi:hypothetical protein